LNRALEDLARQLGRETSGNFIDRQAPFVRPETTMLTIFAGGNDANIIGEAIRAGFGGNDPRAFIDAQVRQWGSDFGEMINRIRSQAPSARIVVLNVPNLGAAPYVATNPLVERSILQRITVGLADQTNALTSRGVLIVDLMCEPRIYNPANFYSDGFHPNDNGYALMADLTYPALANGVASPPQSSCPSRTLLPAF
jgi:lysophospholipase L1-like esterase